MRGCASCFFPVSVSAGARVVVRELVLELVCVCVHYLAWVFQCSKAVLTRLRETAGLSSAPYKTALTPYVLGVIVNGAKTVRIRTLAQLARCD